MVAQEEKEEIAKTTVSLSPAGDIIGRGTLLIVPEAVDSLICCTYISSPSDMKQYRCWSSACYRPLPHKARLHPTS